MAFFREPLRHWLQRLEDMIGVGGAGTVSGPVTPTVVNRIAVWANIGGTAIKNSLVTIDGSGNISTSGTVNGRDLSADGAALAAHIANTSNPHTVTKTQVGLANVTNDAQLKRAANDWSGFSTKSVPVGADVLLLEDSAAAGAKKRLLISDLTGSGSGTSNYLESAQGQVTTDITTSSTTAVDMTGASVTLTTAAGDILLCAFSVSGLKSPSTGSYSVGLNVDGSILYTAVADFPAGGQASGQLRVSGLSAGSHTVKLQWYVDAGTVTCNVAARITLGVFDANASILVERVHA